MRGATLLRPMHPRRDVMNRITSALLITAMSFSAAGATAHEPQPPHRDAPYPYDDDAPRDWDEPSTRGWS